MPPNIKCAINSGRVDLTDQVTYFYSSEVAAALGISASNYSLGYPAPAGHNRYLLTMVGLSGAGVTASVDYDPGGFADRDDSSTAAGWVNMISAVADNEMVVIGEGPVPGSSDGTKFVTGTVAGFRIRLSGVPGDTVTLTLVGQSVAGITR